jgi:hypothetical protein
MKKLITFIFIICAGLATIAQVNKVEGTERIPVDPNTNLITFQEVIQLEGSREAHFNRASEWLHHYYKQPVYVTQVRDAASGVIKGKHQFELIYYEKDIKKRAGLIKYYFKIECRDGRYRWTLDNFVFSDASKKPCERWLDKTDQYYNEQWEDYLEQLRSFAYDDFAKSLQEYMVPPVVVEEEEW